MTYRGLISTLLGNRVLAFLIIGVVSFVFSLAFTIHLPSLTYDALLFMILAIPIFFVVSLCFRKLFEQTSVDWLVRGRTLFWTIFTAPVLLVCFYSLFLYGSGLLPVYPSLQSAFDAQINPWKESPSSLILKGAEWSLFCGACRDFAFGQLDQQWVRAVLVAVGYYALFAHVCSLLAFAYIPRSEYKRLVMPLAPCAAITPCSEIPQALPKFRTFKPLTLGSAWVVIIGTLFPLFHWLERYDSIIPSLPKEQVIQIGDILVGKDTLTLLTEAEAKIRHQLMQDIDEPLGKIDNLKNTLELYQQQGAELQHSFTQLKEKTYLSLETFHEKEMFPRIEQNVEHYLGWYYSITGEYLRIGNLAMGNFEQHMKDKLNEYLMKNIPTRQADLMLQRFQDESRTFATRIDQLHKLTQQLIEQGAEASRDIARMKEKYEEAWKKQATAVMNDHRILPDVNRLYTTSKQLGSADEWFARLQSPLADLSVTLEQIEIYTHEMHRLATIFSQHSGEYLSFHHRMTIASPVGIAGLGTGAWIGSKIAYRIARKKIFQEAIEVVVKQIIKRGTGIGGGVTGGAAVGAGVGSAVPVVGTGAGAVVGAVVGGIGAWAAADYVMIKLEEYISRDRFRREILYGIREQKAAVMQALHDIFYPAGSPKSLSPK